MPRPLCIALIVAISAALLTHSAVAAPGDVTLTTPTVACPKSQVGDEQLQARYDKMWERFDSTIKREAKAVEDGIRRLYDDAKVKGNLDLVLFWDRLKTSFAEAGHVRWENLTQKKDWAKRFQGAEFPEDFTAVLRKCETGYGEAKAELESGYKALVAELTRKGKLAEAQAIKAEMGSIWAHSSDPVPQPVPTPTPTPPKPAPQKPLLERMAGKWEMTDDGVHLWLHANGDAESLRDADGRLVSKARMNVVSPEVVEVRWDNGFRNQFRLAGDDAIAVFEWNPEGKRTRGYAMERIK